MSADGALQTACDLEEIHRIGAIQPHGALIAVESATGRICFASANTGDRLGVEAAALLGRQLDTVLAPGDVARLGTIGPSGDGRKVLSPMSVQVNDGPAQDCLPHRQDGWLILEFTPRAPQQAAVWEEDDLRRQIISDLVRPADLAELAELSADIVRRVNGFDRVMIYRFAEDNHGEVIAESTHRTDSYLGLHYPASDIPEPARRHFRLNAVRAIADVEAPPVPVLAMPGGEGLDLTHSVLRAVPDTHIQYLRNMGVAASTSISLVANDRLWGLIACHHYGPRVVPPETMRFAELLAGTMSALLQGIENRMQLSRAIEAERIAFAMEKQGRGGMALADVVAEWAPELIRLLDSQGLVFRQSGVVSEFGQVPDPRLRYRPLRGQLAEGVAATERLADVVEMDDAQIESAAGAGYMELSGDGQDYLVLVREHYADVVRWAGKPETVAEQMGDGSTRLNPRASFELWREERVGRSKPFDSTDLEALRIVRRALFALNSLEREQAAVVARRQAEAEEERLRLALLDAARKTSMGELASALAHELNQPLAAVSNYINACRAQLSGFDATLPEGFEDLMLDAVSEAARAADLVRRLRDFIAGGTLALEEADLGMTIRQGADLAMVATGTDRPRLVIEMAPDLPLVRIDRVQIGQVILNLAMNAITAMHGRAERVLTIHGALRGAGVQITVEDTGPGIAADLRPTLFEPFRSSTTSGMGIGLSLCRSIVEAHGGRIWAPENTSGGVIALTLPLDGAKRG